jgi:DNA-binding response OmpR family regulator
MILLVEDSPHLGATLSEYLEGNNYPCRWAKNVKMARELFTTNRPNIVLMDIGLPDGDGLSLAAEFKKNFPQLILFFLSAQNHPEVRVKGLELGGDDYITKPFDLKEVVLRLGKAQTFQREIVKLPEEIVHGPLTIWFSRFEVKKADGEIISLSQKECEMLKMLYQSKGRVVSREDIIESIWGGDQYPTNRTVDNYIVRLRKWCESDPARHIDIKSVRGVGYKLMVN